MNFTNIGVLLDRIAAYEQRLEEFYAEIRDRSTDNGVRLLTYYLSRHRRHLPEVLNDYSPQVLERIRQIEYKHDLLLFVLKKEFYSLETPPDKVNGQALLDAAVRYDTALVNVYRKMLEQPLIGPPQDLFDNLIRVEERDIVMLNKMAAMDYF